MTTTRPGIAPLIKQLGISDYETIWRDMQRRTAERDECAPDEIWLLQHRPVYTLGLNCSMLPLRSSTIPVVQTDRGGQITYHGPGQLIAYTLFDLRRRSAGVRQLVSVLEQAVIDLLAGYGIAGERRERAPGVYVEGRKIAALGIRVRRGCSYHGLSLNVDMDLAPFGDIDPCGYEGLEVTQLRDLGVRDELETVGNKLAEKMVALLGPAGKGRD